MADIKTEAVLRECAKALVERLLATTKLTDDLASAEACAAALERQVETMRDMLHAIYTWTSEDKVGLPTWLENELHALLYPAALSATAQDQPVAEYKPCIIENPDGGVAELVLRDVACVYGEERVCRVIRDMTTGEEIGFQWDIPAQPAAAGREGA